MSATVSLPLTVFLITGAAVVLVLLVALVSLVGRRHAAALAEDIASHDALTGARSRRWLIDSWPELSRTVWGLILLDVDDFKAVNERYGHPGGDAVLAEVVRRLSTLGFSVARLGGDEFAVVVPHLTDGRGLMDVQRQIHALVGECFPAMRVVDDSAPGWDVPQVSVSLGSSAGPADRSGWTWEAAVADADGEERQAKRRHHSGVVTR